MTWPLIFVALITVCGLIMHTIPESKPMPYACPECGKTDLPSPDHVCEEEKCERPAKHAPESC